MGTGSGFWLLPDRAFRSLCVFHRAGGRKINVRVHPACSLQVSIGPGHPSIPVLCGCADTAPGLPGVLAAGPAAPLPWGRLRSCPRVPASSAGAVPGGAVPRVLLVAAGWDRCRPRSICALLAPLVRARDLISCLHLLSLLFISSFSNIYPIFFF